MSPAATQEASSADQFKAAKDSLVASLFELSKAATEVSKNAIDYFNLVQSESGIAIEDSKPTLVPTPVIDASVTPAKKTRKSRAKAAAVPPLASVQPVVETIADDDEPAAETTTFLDAPTSPLPPTEDKKTRKKKAPKDPNAPKKPLTSYILFYNHLRASVAEKNTELSQIDIAREISNQWKIMPESDKNYWKSLYEKEKVKYDAAMVKYNATKEGEEPTSGDKRPAEEEAEIIVPIVEPVAEPVVEQPKKKKSKKSKKSKKED